MSANPTALIDGTSVEDTVTASDVADMPEVPAQQVQYLENAPSWDTDDYDEANVFDAMYSEVALSYYNQATSVKARGRQVLRLFGKYKPLTEAFVQAALRGDQVDDALNANIDWEPEGSSEAIVRPLNESTFQDDQGNQAASYTFTPSSTGEYEFIPDTGDARVAEATADEQAFIIFGYVDYNAGQAVPYEHIQETVDDSLGTRRPFYLRQSMDAPGVLHVADRSRGPVMVFPNRTYDADLNVVNTGIRSGLFPVGVEVLVETAPEFGGVQDA